MKKNRQLKMFLKYEKSRLTNQPFKKKKQMNIIYFLETLKNFQNNYNNSNTNI